MRRKELVIAGILTAVLAFMDITGLPSSLFIQIQILDITPFYWTLMVKQVCRSTNPLKLRQSAHFCVIFAPYMFNMRRSDALKSI